jgi:glycogen debranching enzyme
LAEISVKREFYVATGWPRVEEQIRVLKYGPMFAVFDRYGNIRSSGLGEHGIYYRGTRYLSRLTLTLGETPPLFLSSGVRSDNALFSADLTNVDLLVGDKVVLGRGTVHVVRSRLLWDGVCYEQFRVTNYGTSPVNLPLRIEFAADFADIFEVRGVHRARRGERLPDVLEKDQVTLHYRGLDGVNRCTHICCHPSPSEISGSHLIMEAELNPRDTAKFQFTVRCEQSQHAEVQTFDHALAAIADETGSALNGLCTIRTSNHRFDEWLHRSLADVHMMAVGNAETNFPYAGVPWFSTVFGRDGIITALECLWLKPDIGRGVLEYLAATQAQESNPAAEADPGKIVHETRRGEMAALGEVPFGCYYGSVDATPLFIILAGAYFKRSGDVEFVRSLWPNIEKAITWIDRYGDQDGDGFVEYQRQSEKGLVQQGWKDSSDSVFHADGKLAEPPIALCEVQGYVYAAKMHAASIALALGDRSRAEVLKQQARDLQHKFDKGFWCEELSTYALALDRYKKPCRVRTSNAGHCLFTRIADEDKARRIADTLLREDSFSGWGVRTVSSLERNYNPISYHNGSVWPHDNALLATGLANYGMTFAAARLLDALFEASSFFEMSRLPELICGLHRRAGEGPTLYPVACSPQAWSAGAAFMLFAAALGMSLDAHERRVVLDRPVLPSSISSAALQGLQLGNALVDLRLERRPPKVHVEIMKRSGDIDVVVRD